MRHRFTILWALLVFTPATFVGAQSNPFAPAPRAVATQFADGRTTYHLLKPTGASSFTAVFPRIPGAATDRNGLPLAALDVAIVMDGQNASVSVALIYGNPHQHRIEVATVKVTPDSTARVDQLKEYGVWPIVFSIVPLPPTLADAPTVTTASASLEARVEPAPGDGKTFTVVLVNRSQKGVRGIRVEGERQGRRAMSGYRRAPRQTLLIQPGDAFSFEVPSSVLRGPSGNAAVSPVERLTITSISWDDGTVEGEKEPDAEEKVIAAASARQLANVLALLRDAGDVLRPQALPELRGRIDALSIEVSRATAAEVHATLLDPAVLTVERVEYALRTGMQQVRQLVLIDLDAFLNEPAHGSAAPWVSKTMAAYEEWLARAEKANTSSRR